MNATISNISTIEDAHHGFITDIHSDENYLISSSKDWTAVIWSKTNWKKIQTLNHDGWVTCLKLTKNEIITGTSSGSVIIWGKRDGRKIFRIKQPRFSSVIDVESDDKYIYAALDNKTIHVYSINNYEKMAKIKLAGFVRNMKIDRDNIFAALSNGQVGVWDKSSWGINYVIEHSSYKTVNFTAIDRSYIYSVIDNNIKVWLKGKAKLAKDIRLKKKIISFMVDDNFILAALKDKKVHLIDKSTFREETPININETITKIFSDNKHIFVATKNKKIHIFTHPNYNRRVSTSSRSTTSSSFSSKDSKKKVSSTNKQKAKSKDSSKMLVKEVKQAIKNMSYEEIVKFTKNDKRASVKKLVEEARSK